MEFWLAIHERLVIPHYNKLMEFAEGRIKTFEFARQRPLVTVVAHGTQVGDALSQEPKQYAQDATADVQELQTPRASSSDEKH